MAVSTQIEAGHGLFPIIFGGGIICQISRRTTQESSQENKAFWQKLIRNRELRLGSVSIAHASAKVFGSVIEAFQGHHRQPWTITLRDFANNAHKTCAGVGSWHYQGAIGMRITKFILFAFSSA